MRLLERRHEAEDGLAVVDEALGFARRRNVHSTADALALLDTASSRLRLEPDDPAAVVVGTARRSFAEGQVVERAPLVDAFLDLRLALRG